MIAPCRHTNRSSFSRGPFAAALGLAVLGAALGPSPRALAQDLGLKAPPQSRPVLITGARLHPVSSVPMDGWILFDLGDIQGLGMGPVPGGIRVPANVVTIDGKGKHVYPGIVAANTQLGLAEMAAVRASNDFNEVGPVTPEVRAAVAVNPDSTLIPVTRSNGVLTAAVFPEGGRIPGRVSVVRLDGWTWEDMTIKDDAGVSVQWPQMRPVRAPWMETPDQEQSDETRKAVAIIDDAFKSAGAYFAARAADPSLPADLRWDAMRGVFPIEAPKTPPARGTIPPTQNPVFITAQDVDQITAAVT